MNHGEQLELVTKNRGLLELNNIYIFIKVFRAFSVINSSSSTRRLMGTLVLTKKCRKLNVLMKINKYTSYNYNYNYVFNKLCSWINNRCRMYISIILIVLIKSESWGNERSLYKECMYLAKKSSKLVDPYTIIRNLIKNYISEGNIFNNSVKNIFKKTNTAVIRRLKVIPQFYNFTNLISNSTGLVFINISLSEILQIINLFKVYDRIGYHCESSM